MDLLTITLFALALNLDAFGTGVSYGARRIRIPLTSLLLICLISMGAISISMLGGRLIGSFVSVELAKRLGGVILLGIGVRIIYLAYKANYLPEKDKTRQPEKIRSKVTEINIRPLGLVVQILREPASADIDRSGVISLQEALFLGVALAMDSFGAGFAVSMLGFSISATALMVGIGQFILTNLGILTGRVIMATRLGARLTVLPGCILILLGLFKIS